MKLNTNLGTEYLIYENAALGILVAIDKKEQKLIKQFWKKNKGKSMVENNTINGFPLIHSEEQDSLKIDFSEQKSYLIKDLVKFD